MTYKNRAKRQAEANEIKKIKRHNVKQSALKLRNDCWLLRQKIKGHIEAKGLYTNDFKIVMQRLTDAAQMCDDAVVILS